jgi:hypothetical protein
VFLLVGVLRVAGAAHQHRGAENTKADFPHFPSLSLTHFFSHSLVIFCIFKYSKTQETLVDYHKVKSDVKEGAEKAKARAKEDTAKVKAAAKETAAKTAEKAKETGEFLCLVCVIFV